MKNKSGNIHDPTLAGHGLAKQLKKGQRLTIILEVVRIILITVCVIFFGARLQNYYSVTNIFFYVISIILWIEVLK